MDSDYPLVSSNSSSSITTQETIPSHMVIGIFSQQENIIGLSAVLILI
jgi:hypothetical protein